MCDLYICFDSLKLEGVWYFKKSFCKLYFSQISINLHWSWSWSGFILPSATSTLWGVWKPFFYFSQMILILLHFAGRTIGSVWFDWKPFVFFTEQWRWSWSCYVLPPATSTPVGLVPINPWNLKLLKLLCETFGKACWKKTLCL